MVYCPNLLAYNRRQTHPVQVGSLIIGGAYPVRVQSMTNTSTMDTAGSVDQCIRIIDAGADLVRLTAQGEREAANLANIKKDLRDKGYSTPLVADIHFNPKAADVAALNVEKVRINPGNYVDALKTFAHLDYTDEEYARELAKIRDRFVPFLNICKTNQTTIRIGVNHGSLSDRIMSRYGDSPSGMVESCMEFLRICVEENFLNVVISIKASNTLVMVQTVRLMVQKMAEENMSFPLHLGVTEAGDGEDGRIKSAIGTGTLLLDGIGDTIRISLSEDPEYEIPVARLLLEEVANRTLAETTYPVTPSAAYNPFTYKRRETYLAGKFGKGQVPVVLFDDTKLVEGIDSFDFSGGVPKPDLLLSECTVLTSVDELDHVNDALPGRLLLRLTVAELTEPLINRINEDTRLVILAESTTNQPLYEFRQFYHLLEMYRCKAPVVLCVGGDYADTERFQIGLSLDFGPMLLDGFGDGLLFKGHYTDSITPAVMVNTLFAVLQAARLRMSKTDYISCPGCGRTLFDLQQTIARIKNKTNHLKGLKIGIMGCIVNGPGEMADADYGYVGAGRGKISLYKGQTCIERNIPEDQAVEKLIEVLKNNGDWKDPI